MNYYRLSTAYLLASTSYAVSVGEHRHPFPDDVNTRIVGGSRAPDGRYPYYTYIKMNHVDRDGEKIRGTYCGGTLISPTAVVTAAHCVAESYEIYNRTIIDDDDNLDEYNARAHEITIIVGVTDVHEEDTEANPSLVLGVASVEVHPQWDRDEDAPFDYDIALFKIDGYISEDIIQPITLDREGGRIEPEEGDVFTAIGFGLTDPDSDISSTLKHVSLDYITNEECKDYWMDSLITENVMCVYTEDKSTCMGDSGGGLVATDEIGDVLVGITSFGSSSCDYSSGFTRISKMFDWIRSHICEWSPCYCQSAGIFEDDDFIDHCPEVTPAPTASDDSCNDIPGFLDSYGFGCDWYTDIPAGCLLYKDCCENMGHTPATACCKCGGGFFVTTSKTNDEDSESGAIVTTYDGFLESSGIVFSLVAQNDINIDSISFHVTNSNESASVSIYTKSGSFSGYETRRKFWKKLVSNKEIEVTEESQSRSTKPIYFNSIQLNANVTQSLYISVNDVSLVSTEGSSVGHVYASDGVVAIEEGYLVQGNFEDPDSVGKFNGVISYSQVSQTPTLYPSSTSSITPTLRRSTFPSNIHSTMPSESTASKSSALPSSTPSTSPITSLDTTPSMTPSMTPSATPTTTPSTTPTTISSTTPTTMSTSFPSRSVPPSMVDSTTAMLSDSIEANKSIEDKSGAVAIGYSLHPAYLLALGVLSTILYC